MKRCAVYEYGHRVDFFHKEALQGEERRERGGGMRGGEMKEQCAGKVYGLL